MKWINLSDIYTSRNSKEDGKQCDIVQLIKRRAEKKENFSYKLKTDKLETPKLQKQPSL